MRAQFFSFVMTCACVCVCVFDVCERIHMRGKKKILIDVPTAKYFLLSISLSKNTQQIVTKIPYILRGVQNLHTAFLPGETLGQRLRRIRSLSIVCSREREREREKFIYCV